MKIAEIEPPGLHSFEPIALEYLLPKTAQNRHLYENGVSRLIPRLTLKVHSDIETCALLWDRYTKNETLFDLWDFRYAWLKGYGYKQYFYTLYEGKKPLGVLPLWFNEEDKKYEWIGGYWMESNNFFAEDDRVIDLLLSAVPLPITLMSIEGAQCARTHHMAPEFKKEEDLKFSKNVQNYSSLDHMLSTFKKKNRYHLKADHRRIMAQNPKIQHIENDASVLEELFALNIDRFKDAPADDGQSVYHDKKQCDAFRETLKAQSLYSCKFIKTSVGDKTAAVDLLISYNGIYYQMTGANDIHNFNGIGHFMVYVELEDAIKNGYKTVDCLQEDHKWKHRYFDGREMFVFAK